MAHKTGGQCRRIVGEDEIYCEIIGSNSCIDKEGSDCDGTYEYCDFEEYGYAKLGFVFPSLRCPSCRNERRTLNDKTAICSICGKAFTARGGSRRYWKTQGLAQPSEYIISGSLGPECSRCRNLDEKQKKKIKNLRELKQKSILDQKHFAQLLKNRNPKLTEKILEGRLRKVDVADEVKRRDEKGNLVNITYRHPGYAETFDPSGKLLFRTYHKGNYAVHVGPDWKPIAYTFWKPKGLLDEGHYATYKLDLKTVTSRTFEKETYNETLHSDGKRTSVYAE